MPSGVTDTDLLPVVELPPDHAAVLAEVEPPSRLSATTLRAASKCLLSSYFARQSGNPSSGPSVFGTVAHEVCSQVAFEAKLRGQETFTPDEVERVAWRVLVKPEQPNPLSEEALAEIIAMVRRWALRAIFPVKAPYYEVEIFAQHDIQGHTFSGRIDLLAVNGSVAEIDDWKTGRYVPTQQEVEDSHSQLPTYAVHVLEDFPNVETFILREHYLRPGETREITLDVDDVLRHKRWLLLTATRLRAAWAAKAFPPTPGAHCRWCANPGACPLPESARPESIRTDDQAKAQLQALAVERARVKQREKVLRAHLRREDDDPDAIVEAGEGLTARINVLPATTRFDREAAEAAGLDLAPFLKPVSPSKRLKIAGVAK